MKAHAYFFKSEASMASVRLAQWSGLVVPLVTLAVGAVLSMSSEKFLTSSNLVNILTEMSILAIVSFGATLVMVGGAFDLSLGSQVALHGVLAALVMAHTESIPLGVGFALAGGLVFGLMNGAMVTMLSLNPLIATLATMLVGRGVALAVTDGTPVTGLPSSAEGFGLAVPFGLPWVVWLMGACFVAATYVLHGMPLGLQIRATGGNREAARLAGVPVTRVTLATFALSGSFAAFAGIATTLRLRSGQPTAGALLELFALAAVVVGGTSLYGGVGSIWRTFSGVLLLAVIQNGLTLVSVPSAYQEMTIGLLFVVAASSQAMWHRHAQST